MKKQLIVLGLITGFVAPVLSQAKEIKCMAATNRTKKELKSAPVKTESKSESGTAKTKK